MTNDEIAKLAREYAEEQVKCVSFKAYCDPEFKKELHIRRCANDAKQVLEWLLRTHCIVSKEKVRSEYEGLSETMRYAEENSELQLRVVAASKRILLESLFDAETFKNSEV